jgi:hypothetical protein
VLDPEILDHRLGPQESVAFAQSMGELGTFRMSLRMVPSRLGRS